MSFQSLLLRLLPPLIMVELCWLSLSFAHAQAINPWAFQALFAVAFAGYTWMLIYMPMLAQLSTRAQATIVVGGALIFHLTLLPAPFAFSDDIFRYVWDGRVSAAGIDPYRYAPGDPALTALRDERIWPYVNAKAQPSPYPPLLETWFALVYRLFPESILAMKLAMLLLNMGVIVLLMLLLRARQQALIRASIYAWSPQVALQVAFSGHNEPLLLFWLLLALLWGQRQWTASSRSFIASRMRAGWALALATLSKLVPLLAFPVLLRRWGWRAALVYVATIGAVYGALILRGQHVFDGVMSEADVAQFNDGPHYLVARLAGVLLPALAPHVGTLLLVFGVGVATLILLREPSDDMTSAMGTLLATYVLLAASVAPWYTLWILPFIALDALPRLGKSDTRSTTMRLFGGYWWIFSWTVIFSELFYTASRPQWRVVHIVEYLIPAGVMLAVWLWSRRRAGVRSQESGVRSQN